MSLREVDEIQHICVAPLFHGFGFVGGDGILLDSHLNKFLGSDDFERFGATGTRSVRSRANLLEFFDVA